MKSTLISFALFFIISIPGIAQSKDVLAKAAFLKAQELYGNAEYDAAVEKLEEVVSYLGSSNPKVDFLRVQCYYEMGDTENAQKALNSYFKTASDNDPNYMAMLGRVEDVKSLAKAVASSIYLQYKLTSGTTYEVQTNVKTDYVQTSQNLVSVGRFTVLQAFPESYRMKYEFVDPGMGAISPVLNQLLTNKSIEYTMSPLGEIKSIEGATKMMGQVNQELGGIKLKGAEKSTVAAMVGAMNSEAYWKSSLEQLEPYTSDRLMLNQKWVKNGTLGLSANIPVSVEYQLVSVTGSTARINVMAKIPDGTTMQQLTISGSQTGYLEIDINTGIIIQGEIKEEGKRSMPSSPAGATVAMFSERSPVPTGYSFIRTITFQRIK